MNQINVHETKPNEWHNWLTKIFPTHLLILIFTLSAFFIVLHSLGDIVYASIAALVMAFIMLIAALVMVRLNRIVVSAVTLLTGVAIVVGVTVSAKMLFDKIMSVPVIVFFISLMAILATAAILSTAKALENDSNTNNELKIGFFKLFFSHAVLATIIFLSFYHSF